MTLKRMLLVEDNDRDLELTLAALEEFHLANAVDVARDGVEALDYLYVRGQFADRPPGQPIVVLLDIKMPRLNGREVLRRIKADPQFKHLPVVMFTSSREEPDLAECYLLGVNAYVVKPVDFLQFAAAVKQVGAFWGLLNELPSPPELP
ncbi:MAG: response regulator [Verrucomicrobia bacterium]|nr:response regulator [Verrucomicrobiota bacterium]